MRENASAEEEAEEDGERDGDECTELEVADGCFVLRGFGRFRIALNKRRGSLPIRFCDAFAMVFLNSKEVQSWRNGHDDKLRDVLSWK